MIVFSRYYLVCEGSINNLNRFIVMLRYDSLKKTSILYLTISASNDIYLIQILNYNEHPACCGFEYRNLI